MKWIKYKIEQSVINEQPILIDKKMGYSEDNLAIALGEAYNGEYEIEEDDEVIEVEPLSIELGGTGAKALEELKEKFGIKGFVFRGVDPLNTSEEDTPAFWKDLGPGIWEFTGSKGIPVGFTGNYGKGTLVQISVANSRITQLFISDYGLYHRSSATYYDTWTHFKKLRKNDPWLNLNENALPYKVVYTGGNHRGENSPNIIEVPNSTVSLVIIHSNCITDALIMQAEGSGEATWMDAEGTSHFVNYQIDEDRENKKTIIRWYANSVESQKNVQDVEYHLIALP